MSVSIQDIWDQTPESMSKILESQNLVLSKLPRNADRLSILYLYDQNNMLTDETKSYLSYPNFHAIMFNSKSLEEAIKHLKEPSNMNIKQEDIDFGIILSILKYVILNVRRIASASTPSI